MTKLNQLCLNLSHEFQNKYPISTVVTTSRSGSHNLVRAWLVLVSVMMVQ